MQSIQVHDPSTTLRSTISTGAPHVGSGSAAHDSTGAPHVGSGSAAHDSTGAKLAALGRRDYLPGLAASELVAEIRALLAIERRTERLVCRYLADLADRIQARQDAELGVCGDEFDVARHCLGLGERDTRERVRVGRALRKLGRIERAFMDGELCYSRVREVTRVATVHTEEHWLVLARRLEMRSLERRVAAEREAAGEKSDRHDEQRPGERARTHWMRENRVRVTIDLSAEAWALLERAMREARQAGIAGGGDGDALEAVARAALARLRTAPGDAADRASPGPNRGDSEEDRGDARKTEATARKTEATARKTEATARKTEATARKTEATARKTEATARKTEATARKTEDSEEDRGDSEEDRGDSEEDRGDSEEDRGAAGPERSIAKGRGYGEATRCEMVSELRTATQSGSAAERVPDRRIDDQPVRFAAQGGEPERRLLGVMGCSRGWTLDALTESSGLSVQQVCMALTLLELGGRVRRRAFAFDPV